MVGERLTIGMYEKLETSMRSNEIDRTGRV